MKSLMITLLLAALSGCSNSLVQDHLHYLPDGENLTGAGWAFGLDHIDYRDGIGELMQLSPELHGFIARHGTGKTPERRFRNIIAALRKQRFHLSYDLDSTLTAAEAFTTKKGNCVSFAALLVSLARAVGVEARFNLSELPVERNTRTGSSPGSYIQNVLHMNTLATLGGRREILELNFGRPLTTRINPISDGAAGAMYLNNLAMSAMYDNRLAEAFTLSASAIRLDPESGNLWAGLGSIFRRAGMLDFAEQGYGQALRLDSRNHVARRNLQRVHQQLGRDHLRDEQLASN